MLRVLLRRFNKKRRLDNVEIFPWQPRQQSHSRQVQPGSGQYREEIRKDENRDPEFRFFLLSQ